MTEIPVLEDSCIIGTQCSAGLAHMEISKPKSDTDSKMKVDNF